MVTTLRRLDLIWADLDEPAGRRPVCILTRTPAIDVLNAVVCAPVTRTIRQIASEVQLDPEDGLGVMCAINCDTLITVPKSAFDPQPVGHLSAHAADRLDAAIRYALNLGW